MINAKDIRIGNIVQYRVTKENKEVTANIILAIANGSINYVGIPITPEILEQCGFEQHGLKTNYYLQINRAEISCFIQRRGLTIGVPDGESGTIYFSWHIKYLHELQNLIHSLSGTELTIKS